MMRHLCSGENFTNRDMMRLRSSLAVGEFRRSSHHPSCKSAYFCANGAEGGFNGLE